jgi:hypothetical protein
MHHIREAFRDRVAKLVADGRAVKSADGVELLDDLPDLVEKQAEAIIAAAADNVDAIVARVVPESLRTAVLWRLFERADLIPWPRPWAFDQRYRWEGADFADDVEVDRYLTLLYAERPGEAEKLVWCMWLWRLQCTIDVVDAHYDPRWRDRDRDAWLRSEVAGGWPGSERVGEFGYRIDGLIPPQKAPTVDRIVAAHGPCDIQTARLVAWFFVDETRPERLAETAAGAVLAEDAKKGHDLATHPDAGRDLSRQVARAIPGAPMASDAVEAIDGVQPLDEALAALVEGFGQTGRMLAGVIRDTKKKTPGERAARWRPLVDPLRVPRILARALWDDVVSVVLRGDMEQEAHARARREKVPAPTMHPAPRSAILFAPLGGWRTNRDGSLETGDVDKRRGYLPPVAMVSVGERALSSAAGKIVPTLAALLSREAWDRWVRGVDRFDWIAVPAGQNALHARGIDATEDELDEAIAWLQDLKVGGLPCIDASPPPQEVMGDERHAGRPEKRRIVRVGAPLAPMGLESVYRDAGMVLPPELRFFSPVLDPAEAPLIGHRQTYARQRDFYALGIGSFFVEHREQYAERGGVKIDLQAWRRFLDARGIYHRSHHSLADQMWDAYRGHRKPGLPGIGPRAAVLVETAPGSGVYRLGPDFAEQERVVLNAAERTAKRRRDSKKRSAAKRRSETGS